MSIESLLESKQWTAPVNAATITTIIGNAVVTGTNLTNFDVGDIVWYTDDGGVFQQGQFKTITDATNAELEKVALTTATAKATRELNAAAQTMHWFRCDNSVIRVPIVDLGGDSRIQGVLGTPDAIPRSQISINEGVLVKTVYLRMPYQFTMADSQLKIDFNYIDNAGALIGRVQSIGEDSGIFIPRENNEIEINAFIPTPVIPFGSSATVGTWQLSMSISNAVNDSGDTLGESMQLADVSMVNSPDVLNGQQVPISLGVRIVHANAFITA